MSGEIVRLADHDALDAAVDFDRPFRVLDEHSIDFPADAHEAECYVEVDAEGSIVEGGEADLIESLRRQGWEPVDGYSGQQGYSGPIMHASEYLGGGMARDVLQAPGIYVVQAVECIGFGDEGANVQPGDAAYSDEPAGWILLRRRDQAEAGS